MRPRGLDEYVGQAAILGPGRLLRRAIQGDQLSSLIFYGPPGSGKTTLARVIANTTKSRFITINAVLSGIADLRVAIEDAKSEKDFYGRRTILFIDEVHRWNKAQQDALLPWVENGTFILIGATTENPYFEVNRALVSRSRIFRLEPLDRSELMEVARRALADKERGYGKYRVTFEEGALEHLVETASGDARSLLNALELAVETGPSAWPPPEGADLRISLQAAEESIQRKVVLYDRDGDYHYDVISAFIKSLRGSDPDAALYWLARMVEAGESPSFIFRRMLVAASEDVGLAAPEAIGVVEACAAAFDRVGFPEGSFHLTQAALFLANCPKSNSALGYFDALESVRAENREVPDHLKDASRDGEGLGHGQGYIYPHAYRDHWVAQAYLPDALKGRIFYHPSSNGWEARACASLGQRRELQLAAYMESHERFQASSPQAGTSRASPNQAEWRRLSAAGDREAILERRTRAFDSAKLRGNERIVVLNAGEGLFIWEALRRAPAGLALGLCREAGEKEALEGYAASLPETERPLLLVFSPQDHEGISRALGFRAEGAFEAAFARLAIGSGALGTAQLLGLSGLLSGGAPFALADTLPGYSSRPSDLLADEEGADAESIGLRQAEDAFYAGLYGLDALPSEPSLALTGLLGGAGFSLEHFELETEEGRRYLSSAEERAWLSPSSQFGSFLRSRIQAESLADIERRFAELIGQGREFPWKRAQALVLARKAG
jgi:putative ATPase